MHLLPQVHNVEVNGRSMECFQALVGWIPEGHGIVVVVVEFLNLFFGRV
jgi:hypothetical protein